MAIDQETQKLYEKELNALIQAQKEEIKKKTNPLFAKMHGMSEEETEDLKKELEKAHELQRREIAKKYGVPLD